MMTFFCGFSYAGGNSKTYDLISEDHVKKDFELFESSNWKFSSFGVEFSPKSQPLFLNEEFSSFPLAFTFEAQLLTGSQFGLIFQDGDGDFTITVWISPREHTEKEDIRIRYDNLSQKPDNRRIYYPLGQEVERMDEPYKVTIEFQSEGIYYEIQSASLKRTFSGVMLYSSINREVKSIKKVGLYTYKSSGYFKKLDISE